MTWCLCSLCIIQRLTYSRSKSRWKIFSRTDGEDTQRGYRLVPCQVFSSLPMSLGSYLSLPSYPKNRSRVSLSSSSRKKYVAASLFRISTFWPKKNLLLKRAFLFRHFAVAQFFNSLLSRADTRGLSIEYRTRHWLWFSSVAETYLPQCGGANGLYHTTHTRLK
jgi:hypothetical protein